MKHQSGNALFLILIAVALFAALSYAITQSGRGGGGIDREQAALSAARIMDYTSLLSQGITRLKLIGGVPDNMLDFDSEQRLQTSGAEYSHDNTLCTTADCELFSAAGGGMVYQNFENIAATPVAGWGANWEGPGHWSANAINFEGQGSDLPDIVFRMANMDANICAEINRRMGVEEDPTITNTGETNYYLRNDTTAALAATDALTFGDDDPDLNGATTFCADSSFGWVLYSILLAR